jgi:hypothetical protein
MLFIFICLLVVFLSCAKSLPTLFYLIDVKLICCVVFFCLLRENLIYYVVFVPGYFIWRNKLLCCVFIVFYCAKFLFTSICVLKLLFEPAVAGFHFWDSCG